MRVSSRKEGRVKTVTVRTRKGSVKMVLTLTLSPVRRKRFKAMLVNPALLAVEALEALAARLAAEDRNGRLRLALRRMAALGKETVAGAPATRARTKRPKATPPPRRP